MAEQCAKYWRRNFYVEFNPVSNLLKCFLTLNSSRQADFKWIKVHIEDDAITVYKDDEQHRYMYQFEDLELLPVSCRGLKFHRTGQLFFSIQGKKPGLKEDVTEVLYREKKKFSLQNDIVDNIQLYQNKWFCSVCKQKILKDSSCFRRVLPLPSENWSDFADMWFCHKHEHTDTSGTVSNNIQNGKLLPKQSDCFVGDTYVLISDCHTDRKAVRLDGSGAITCGRCGLQIGDKLENKDKNIDGVLNGSQVYKFYLYSLVISDLQNSNSEHHRYANRLRSENFFSLLLEEQSQIYTSFRFILESSVRTVVNQNVSVRTSYCLVWLLDTNASVYTSDGDDLLVDKNDCCDQNNTRACKLVKKQIMKVLFKCHLSATGLNRPPDYPTKSVISLWKKDNTVHSITLPHPVFLQLVDQLIWNSKSLPASQRLLNGFHVSFLR